MGGRRPESRGVPGKMKVVSEPDVTSRPLVALDTGLQLKTV